MTFNLFTRSFAALVFAFVTLVFSAPLAVAQSSITGSYDFNWRADKADQAISLSGSVPSEQIQRFLVIRAGKSSSHSLLIAKGAPENFISFSIAGLDALKRLDSGSFFLVDGIWTLSGVASSQSQKDDMIAVLTLAINTQDWAIDVSVDEPELVVVEAPISEPTPAAQPVTQTEPPAFRWAAQKSVDGALRFSGMVPSEQLQNFLTLRAKNVARDTTQVGEGAPAGFMTSALAAIKTLHELKNGRVVFANDKWTIYGLAADEAALQQAMTDLADVGEAKSWAISIDVEAIEVAQIVEPEPAPELTPTPEVEPIPAPEPAPVTLDDPKEKLPAITGDPNYQFNALRADGGDITLSGNLPASTFANYISGLAGDTSIENIQFSADTPDNFRINAITGTKALASLQSGLLAYENGQWALIGDALGNANLASAKQMILALENSEDWNLDIVLVPAIEICRMSVAEFTQNKTILFAPASAQLTAESRRNVTDFAQNLNNCARAFVYVSGHTDADGPADDNMALSVARAEAVVTTLIEAGVDVSRLYAVGYGETLPIATNDTRAGKARNRRIEFELADQ